MNSRPMVPVRPSRNRPRVRNRWDRRPRVYIVRPVTQIEAPHHRRGRPIKVAVGGAIEEGDSWSRSSIEQVEVVEAEDDGDGGDRGEEGQAVQEGGILVVAEQGPSPSTGPPTASRG